jgi:hypothetical protein
MKANTCLYYYYSFYFSSSYCPPYESRRDDNDLNRIEETHTRYQDIRIGTIIHTIKVTIHFSYIHSKSIIITYYIQKNYQKILI